MGHYAIKTRDASRTRAEAYQKIQFDKKKIIGGANDSVVDGDIVSDDGVIGNPKTYPPSRTLRCVRCALAGSLTLLWLLRNRM